MPGKNLTRAEAEERAALVDVHSYTVDLDLTTSPETFRSRTRIEFSARRPEPTFVDFVARSVERLTLNGTELDPATCFDGARIALPALADANVLEVDGTAVYMNTGEGLHRFVDPVDGEVYLYTQFEVPDSRRMFAVFEQPDLKSTFAFTVTAPDHWQVVSVSPTPEPAPAGEGTATWAFAPTERISSYITALVAGPYDVVRDSVSTRKGEIALGIFCRRSLREYLDHEELFDLTKRGFAWFEEAFDCEYPFSKYDQLFSPEYNMGAMENAGCVTINEIYVFRAKVTEAIVERRALTVLHELAHMWFGNLVTMRWWDDLWLNESFAEWASTVCQAEATRWTSAWTTFHSNEKSWAYNQDQLSSTHPVVAPIRDLEDVEVNFDGITYAKGGSVLKQLVAYVGREPFMEGLRAYFRKHAWGNTTLADLLRELEAASGRELGEWSRLWLETSGVNTLRPVVEVDADGLITSAAIEQTHAVGFPTLRPHRLAVGLYDVHEDGLVRSDRLELDVAAERTELPQLIGRPQPDLLLVNDEDLTYAKIRLDDRSMATTLAHPRGFADSLPRSIVLGAAWDMTRDAEMRARDFARLVLSSLPGETDSTLLKNLLSQLQTAVTTYAAPEHREELRAGARDDLRRLASEAPPSSDAQLQLVTAHAALLRPGDDTAWVRGLLDGTTELPGLAVDTEMRWTLLTALAATGSADPREVEEELARDNTSTGNERAARARASVPTAAAKAGAWSAAIDADDLPTSVVEAVGMGFGRSPRDLLVPYVPRYLDMLESTWAARTHAVGEAVVLWFYPRGLADQGLVDATNAWLEAHPDAPAGLRRLVSENRDATVRAVAAQAADAQG